MGPEILIAVSVTGGLVAGFLLTWALMGSRYNAERTGYQVAIEGLRKEREADREKFRWLENAEEKLRDSFNALASQALRNNSTQFINQAKEQMETIHRVMKGDWNTQKQEMVNIVNPLEKDLEKLDRQVRALEEKREGAYKTLETHIVELSRAQGELRNATVTLSQALKSSSVRGKWGEVQLRRIAEMAGMLEHVDFNEQIQAEGGTGKPDMIIRMPGEGIIPVDSKVPMNSYLDAHEADNENIRKSKLGEHARSLRNHMKSLAQKAYWAQFASSPEFVVMLVPYESGLSAAFTEDPSLLEDALANRVIIVSPATLLALLKVASMGWMQLRLSRNARKIADQGKELYNRFGVFTNHFAEVGKKLTDSVTSYNRAVGSMETRVLPSARKLKELGAGSTDIGEIPGIEQQARLPLELNGENESE